MVSRIVYNIFYNPNDLRNNVIKSFQSALLLDKRAYQRDLIYGQ